MSTLIRALPHTMAQVTNVELFNADAHPDGWHDVRSPGGYDWWYFDAEDSATDTQVVAIFMQGFIFHPGYLRQYARYRRRPTRHRPPLAADFPCVYLAVYRGGEVWKQLFTQYPSSDFSARTERCKVVIGESVLTRDGGRFEVSIAGVPWHLTSRGPVREAGTLSAQLRFTPGASSDDSVEVPRRFLPRESTHADHFWSIVAPRCAVEASIRCGDETIHLAGRGYHDHNYGTAPIGEGLSRWTWGRAFFGENRVVTFHYPELRKPRRPRPGGTEPQEPGRPRPGTGGADRGGDGPAPIHHLVEERDGVMRDLAVEHVAADWSLVCNPAMRLKYPRSLDFGPALRLTQPRIIDPSPFYLRLQFAAESFGERSTAFCEIAYPHRLRWPILGRLIEMSFDKR